MQGGAYHHCCAHAHHTQCAYCHFAVCRGDTRHQHTASYALSSTLCCLIPRHQLLVTIVVPAGVDTLSTIPLWNSPTSSYYIKAVRDTLMVHSRIPGVANNSQFFNTPTAAAFTGSGTVSATGKLVDCGLGTKQCTNATGRICLIQRGNNTFCEKVTNCMAGGGSGALVFNRDDLPDCDVLIGTLTGGTAACTAPADGFVISISIAKAQGSALRDALSAGRSVSVTLTYPTATLQTSLALDIYSGTSMATPTAAGESTACMLCAVLYSLLNT